MAQFGRTIVDLSGWVGAPGVNVYHWMSSAHLDIDQNDVDEFHDILNTAFTALGAGMWATGVTWTINPEVSVHDVATGTLVGAFVDAGGPYTDTGTGAGQENRATQCGVSWLTGNILRGRRVRGRTFLGPLSGDLIDTSGQISPANQAIIEAAMSGIFDPLGSRLIVWSRPVGVNAGEYADVTGVDVSGIPWVLRGRRD